MNQISDKIPVMVFLAVGVCSCSQTGFLGRVYEAIRKYRDVVDYREYSAGSDIAKRYGISYRGVVVGSKSVGSNPTTARIEEAILKEIEKQDLDSM
ncbi:MAG: hypothetical protein JSW61_08265 [Candidatus Thorarchaeota archaeon]|nr:MAG: hypothetical protein JSW61_08265 [Candidatus Thorarchaeota archaeon]